MAIKGFKDIVDNKGYRVSKKDRAIIERELKKSLFGVGNGVWYRHGETDAIEFILYDSNDNQLPQGDDGRLVRYIYLDDVNIKEYFIINEDETSRKKINDAREYIVDSEKLIKEAGYSNGIFKAQITLLNRRLGSEERPFDKVWIHEISPSRTEIRVLPTKDNDDMVLPDLQERYNIFTEDKNFRDDTILAVRNFIEQIDLQKVFENFLKSKGTVSEGQSYVSLIKKEFGLESFEGYLARVKSKYIQAMDYYAANREYDVFSLNYGKPLTTVPPIDLSIETIISVATDVLYKVIDRELPNRNLQPDVSLSLEDQITFDALQPILKSASDGSIYESTIPPSVGAIIRGCTNPDARNYNPLAVQDDGSCIIDVPAGPTEEPKPIPEIRGCTNKNASNYNPLATVDDGSCILPTLNPDLTTERYFCHSDNCTVRYVNADGNVLNRNVPKTGITIRYQTATPPDFAGDVRTYEQVVKVILARCSDPNATNFGEVGACVYSGYPSRGENDYVEEQSTIISADGTRETVTIRNYY